MRATILGLARDEIADPHIESHVEPASYPALESTAYEALDGSTIYAGNAAAQIDVESETVYVSEDAIVTEREPDMETVACEWIADLEAGWLGVNRSDGDWLFDSIGGTKGTLMHRAVIDVKGFAAHLSDYPSASAWNVTRTRSLDADGDAEEATINYHDAAHLSDTQKSGETTMLGFEYHKNGYRRGVVSESGYVALFDGGDRPEHYAEFINSEILPFAELPEEFQGALSEVRDAGDEEVTADVE